MSFDFRPNHINKKDHLLDDEFKLYYKRLYKVSIDDNIHDKGYHIKRYLFKGDIVDKDLKFNNITKSKIQRRKSV
jgi:hypothetical protein